MSSKVTQRDFGDIKKVSVATQTKTISRDYVPTSVTSWFYREEEAFPKFLYKSHTITQMIVLLVILITLAYTQEGQSLTESIKMGYIFACVTLMVYGTIYLPNALIQRPHPVIWRFLQALGLCYLMSLVFCLFLSREQLQEFFRTFVDPSMGQPLPEKSYVQDCRLFTPENSQSNYANLVDCIDVFVAAHLIGWIFKVFILRDVKLAMIQQLVFEFMEITFRYWLPNFWECWWDQIILDILLCNTGGILVGWWLMKKFKMNEYRWSLNFTRQNSYRQNLKFLLFQPHLDKHEWKVFHSTKRFLSVVWLMALMQLTDLSFFFNKYILWIETKFLIKIRLGFGLLSISAARDYYVYLTDDDCHRAGPNFWLFHMIVLTEWLIFFKNYNNSFTESLPMYVKVIWAVIGVVFSAVIVFLVRKDLRKQKNGKEYETVEE